MMRRWWRRRPPEDFAAELEAHLALETQDLMAQRGLSESDARLAARKAFGNITTSQERYYESSRWLWLDRYGQHIRYALRGFRQRPAFGVAIVATLAIGVGLNTAIFTIAYSFLARPLPVRDASRIVNVYQELRGRGMREVHGTKSILSYAEFRSYAAAPAFVSAAAYADIELAVPDAPNGTVRGQLVSCDYFRTFDVRLALGRSLHADECTEHGGEMVAVLGHGLWTRQFGGDSSAIGRTIRVNTLPFTIVGVAEPGFAGVLAQSAELWVPVTAQPALAHGRDSLVDRPNVSWLVMAGRLAPGATIDQARAQVARVASHPDPAFPARVRVASVVPGAYFNFPEVRRDGGTALALILLLGLVIVVMACANVVNLLLARGLARRREIGIRLAVGASRWRLIEQLLVEALLLSALGSALGVALVAVLPLVLRAIAPVDALQVSVAPNLAVVLYAFAVGIAAALGAGLMPALQTTRVDLVSAFKGAAGIGDSRNTLRSSTLRAFAVGVQMAGSALLLVLSTLLFRAASRASDVDPGYATRNVVAFRMNLRQLGYEETRAAAVYDAIAQRLESAPDVDGVALASRLPLLGSDTQSLTLDGAAAAAERPRSVNVNEVRGSYFETMGIRILRGRTFTDAELRREGDRPSVVSASMASTIWPNAEAIGQRFNVGGHWYRVVGIAAEARTVSLGEPVALTAYLGGGSLLDGALVVRTAGLPTAVMTELPKWTRLIDPQIAVRPELFADRIALVLQPAKLTGAATAGLGMIAMLLASIGIASVVGFSVSQRRRVVGIRLALGATGPGVVRLMMQQGAWAVGVGLGAGIVLAAGVSLVIRSMLLGLNPFDPFAYLVTAIVLLGAAVGAMYVPSRRAAHTDPASTLREE